MSSNQLDEGYIVNGWSVDQPGNMCKTTEITNTPSTLLLHLLIKHSCIHASPLLAEQSHILTVRNCSKAIPIARPEDLRT